MKTKIVITLTALLVLIGINAKVQNDNQDPGTTSIVGDLNNDNKVNAADIVLLINNLKSKTGDQSTTLPDGTYAKEDVNKDGYVNETDLSALVNIVMKDDGLKDLEGEELYEIVRSDLDEFISTHEGATIEDILTEIANYPSKVTTKVEDNILYIDIDGYGYMCDPYGLTLNDHIEDNAIDDNYIENLLMEINNALYPDNAKARSLNVMEGNNSYSTSTGGTANDIVLSKKKILVWNPFDNNTFIYVPEGFKVDEYFHNSKLLGLPTFSDYDIVLMDCHGSKKGEVMVPREDYENQLKGFPPSDYMLGEIKSGGKLILTYVLKESILEKLISKDLSHTMVWTSMCHSNIQNSVIKKVLKGHKAIAFAGANNKVADYVVKDRFTKFITAYYKRISAAEAAKKSFKDSKNISDKGTNYSTREYEYKDEKEVLVKGVLRGYDYHNVEEELVEGTYSFEYYNQNNMYTPFVTAMAAIENQPCASVTLPYELATPVMASRATTRATSASNISAGFWYKNKKTNEETEREFDKSTTKLHQRYDYEQLVSRLELLGDIADLAPGTYEYRTYLEIDGEKSYSDDMYEFTINTPVSITDFKITLIQHLDGQLFDVTDRVNYSYRFGAAFTLKLNDSEGVEDWGYYYITPAGKTKKVSLSKHGNTCDVTCTFYNNESVSTLKIYGYVKKVNRNEIYSFEIDEYDLEYLEKSCPDGNHPHKIDLGLPSGTLWSCCNVGATKPEGYGKYYAWGETTEKGYYTKETYKWHDGSTYIVIGNDIAGTEYDVAHVEWKGPWKMPSDDQNRELWNNTSKVWETRNGVVGLKFVAPNGGTIFLPASGWKGKLGEPSDLGYGGHYWSSSFVVEEFYTSNARCLKFTKGGFNGNSGNGRNIGQTIRPICE